MVLNCFVSVMMLLCNSLFVMYLCAPKLLLTRMIVVGLRIGGFRYFGCVLDV